MATASTSLEHAAERLRDRLAGLESAVEALAAERGRLRAELAGERQARSDAERRNGEMEAELAALRRYRTALAERLDGVIARVETEVRKAG